MTRSRRTFTSQEKATIVLRHLIDKTPVSVTQYVHHYNTVRLHSANGYVTPHTKLAGKEKELFAQQAQKLEAARERRRLRRAEAMQNVA